MARELALREQRILYRERLDGPEPAQKGIAGKGTSRVTACKRMTTENERQRT